MSKRPLTIRILKAVALICVVCRFHVTEDFSKPSEAIYVDEKGNDLGRDRRVVGGS